jgi:2-polyprenyl-6-methoxyphenol hydroxylase-like FAD-dependent oxidoreductase
MEVGMTRAVVVGGGLSGLASSLVLALDGGEAELVERSAHVGALGSGITLNGAAIRALDDLGVVAECLAAGYGSTEFEVCDPAGVRVSNLPLEGNQPGLPGMLGMRRADLHRILLGRAESAGVRVRTGVSPVSIEERPDAAQVVFSDGSRVDADLVVGADGMRSRVRDLVFGPVRPVFRGQAYLRAMMPRMVDKEVQVHGVRHRHVGFTPVNRESMYLYCCVPVPDASRPAQTEVPGMLRKCLESFGGVVAEAREWVGNPALTNYAVLETVLADPPWCSGRTVLVGDAAHCTTPQLAAGSAMCLEDALVLRAELANAESPQQGAVRYSKRRYDRCKYVVEASVQLSAWQIQPETPDEDQRQLFAESMGVLAEPY